MFLFIVDGPISRRLGLGYLSVITVFIAGALVYISWQQGVILQATAALVFIIASLSIPRGWARFGLFCLSIACVVWAMNASARIKESNGLTDSIASNAKLVAGGCGLECAEHRDAIKYAQLNYRLPLLSWMHYMLQGYDAGAVGGLMPKNAALLCGLYVAAADTISIPGSSQSASELSKLLISGVPVPAWAQKAVGETSMDKLAHAFREPYVLPRGAYRPPDEGKWAAEAVKACATRFPALSAQ